MEGSATIEMKLPAGREHHEDRTLLSTHDLGIDALVAAIRQSSRSPGPESVRWHFSSTQLTNSVAVNPYVQAP